MTDPADNAKSRIRSLIQQRLAALPEGRRRHASHLACTRLSNLDAFRHASVIMLYLPRAGEVDPTSVAISCFQRGKTVCVPRLDWPRREMTAIEATSLDEHFMTVDNHGAHSPRVGRPLTPDSIDVVVMPGIAFDLHGSRLGRGSGFYERFLGRLQPSALTVGLAFDQQVIQDVPAGADVCRVGCVITDRRIAHVRRSRSRR